MNNWNQVASQTNYFDTFLGASPFLHTWSLAIEEQFYLVWPPLLAAFLARRGGRVRGLPALIAAGAVVSAAIMVLRFDPTNPGPAYVATDARLQTIALGALAATVMMSPDGPRVRAWLQARPRAAGALAAACLLGLLATMALAGQSSEWLFHGGFLVVAAVAAVLLTTVTHGPAGIVARVLSVRPLVAVGVISYGLYLWHWPVFTLLDSQRLGLRGLPLAAAQFAITFGLAIASYRLVERPVRRRVLATRYGLPVERAVLGGSVAAAAALAVLVSATSPAVAANGVAEVGRAGTGAVSVFVYGDSVSFGLRRDFVPASHPALAVSGSTQLGCPAFPVTNSIDGRADPPAPECQAWYDRWQSELKAAVPSVAVLPSSQWLLFDPIVDGRTLTLGSPEWATWLTGMYDAYVDPMKAQAPHVVLVNQPCYRIYDDGKSPYPRTINDDSRVATYNAFLTSYAAARGLPLLDLNSWLCGPGKDPEWIDGVKTRVEGLHFTYEGAQLVWNWLAPQLEQVSTTPAGTALAGSG